MEISPCFKTKHIELITNVEGTNNSSDSNQDASNSHKNDNQTLFTAAAQTDKHKKRKKQKEERNITRIFVIIFTEFFLL